MSVAPGVRLGHYEVLAPLGAGGMGEVYRARDTVLGREVALKVLPGPVASNPAALARFEREARAVAALSHPNIVAIHEFGRDGATAFAVTELLEGETLRQRLSAGALPPSKTIDYAIQVANGLAAAHAKALVHRDLKPENLFLTRDGRVKILDFGLVAEQPSLAGDQTSSPTLAQLSEPGWVVGTVGYMSPEQVRGARVDGRSDLFALGAVLYEMLSGRRAFQRETAAETMTAILREDVPEISASGGQVPVSLERLVRRCLEKQPDERLQSAHDLAIALEAVSGSRTATVASVPLPLPPRHRLRGVGLVTALVIAGALAGFLAARTVGSARRASGLPEYHPLTSRRGFVSDARFSSNGASVVYSAIWDSEPLSVFSQPSDAPQTGAPPLVKAALLAASRAGKLAVGVNASLEHLLIRGMLAELSPGGGAPRELLEDVTAADWSPDERLAVVRAVGGHVRLEFPIGTVLYETTGWLSSPRFSPGGESIAFLEQPLHGDDRGWPAVVEISTRAKRDLTTEYSTVQGLAWTPDGRQVCVASHLSIECIPRSGGKPLLVLRGPARFHLHDIAPDGRLLVSTMTVRGALMASVGQPEVDVSWLQFSVAADVDPANRRVLFETFDYGIYLRRVDGTPPVRLGEGVPTELSPDRRRVLAIVPGVPTRLALIPTGAGETITLPSGTITEHIWASWTPDGRRVVVSGVEQGRHSRLYLQDVEGGGAPRPLTKEGVRLPSSLVRLVSPDGRVVTALGPDGRPALYPLDGGDPLPMPGIAKDLKPLSWTDQPGVLFATTRSDDRIRPVYRVDLATGRRQLWKQLGPENPAGAPKVFPIAVSADGTSYAYTVANVDVCLFAVSGVLTH